MAHCNTYHVTTTLLLYFTGCKRSHLAFLHRDYHIICGTIRKRDVVSFVVKVDNHSSTTRLNGEWLKVAKKEPPQLVATTNLTGAGLTGATAFILVWLVHWSRGRASGFSTGRFLVVLAVFAAVATTCYAYVRRQWLQYLRQQAVDGASLLITNLQAFEASTSSALALIQEVELVSRGYRM